MKTLRYATLVAIAFVPVWVRQRVFERAVRGFADKLVYDVDRELGKWSKDLVRQVQRAMA